MNKSVTVLGAGAWGTAFSTLLAENGYVVNLWSFEEEVVEDILNTRINSRYLPGIKLDLKIKPTCDLVEAMNNSRWIFEVVPVKFLRSILQQIKTYANKDQIWVLLSKGIEKDSLFLPSNIIDDVFGFKVNKLTLGGPNFAKDFAERSCTATTIGCVDCALGIELQKMIANFHFRPYLSRDLVGVQIGGAIKNVLSLTVGIFRGAKYKDNTVAFLLTRGLVEMVKIAEFYGGRQDTIYGLSGLGDFVLSAFGAIGRNQKVGMMIGEGFSLDNILKTTGLIPEGVNTVESVKQIIDKSKLDLPICLGTYEIIFKGRKPKSLLDELMDRPLAEECIIK